MTVARSGAASAGQALGLASGERLVAKDVITDADGSAHVRYDRTFDGLRVVGGDLVTHRDRSGQIRAVSWNGAHQVAVASTRPKVSLLSARAAGRRKASSVQETTAGTRGELVVYSGSASGKATPRLAYDVLTAGVRDDQTPSRLHTFIDADTGGTLASWDEIEDGTGNSIHGGTVTIGTTAGIPPGPGSLRDGAGNETTDLNGLGNGAGTDLGTVHGTTFTDADDIWGNGTVTDRASAGVDAHYGAEQTFAYYKNVLGRNGIWDTGVGARSRVHYGRAFVNAFWDGTQMTYGDGAGNTHPLVELDVAGHEMSHGLTENTAGLVYAGEAGGLNEATSDIFGTAVEWYADNATDRPDYLIGEQVDINGDGTPLRYLDRPSRDGSSPDCWSRALGDLDVHSSSGPLNHWFYLASEGSGPKDVNGVHYDSPTCGAPAVTPIGRDKAAKIWYRALTTYLTSSGTYAAAREGAIQSAKDLYGAASPECTGIAASFSAIGVPPGGATCGAAEQPPSCSNLLRNPGFESGDTLWAGTANVIGQWGINPSLQPSRSGTWSAWLGGYGTTHDDSISQVVTIPADRAATLSYFVHIETAEPLDATFDRMTVRAGSTVLQTLSNRNAADGYQRRTVDLSAYAGRTISISFSGAENASAATSFVLDDISVASSTAPAAPTGTVAAPGNARALVSWTAPASDGGCPITGYAVRVVNVATSEQVGAVRPAAAGTRSLMVTDLTNGTAYSFQVLASNVAGSGPYSALSSPVTLTAPVSRLSDYNRDGFTDLVARDTAGVLWLYPGNGTGRFQTRLTLGAGGWNAMTALVSPGDVTGDGNADLLARDAAGVLWLYPGNGTSGLGVRREIGTGWSTYTITGAADLNAAGRPDLLARDAAGVLWLYPLSGSAVFGTRTRVSTGWGGYTFLGAGDVSGDGRADILARDPAGSLWLYPGNGAGSVFARIPVSGGWQGSTALATIGNFDRLAGNDLVTRDSAGRLWLYPGDNAGRLGPRQQIGARGWNVMSYLG